MMKNTLSFLFLEMLSAKFFKASLGQFLFFMASLYKELTRRFEGHGAAATLTRRLPLGTVLEHIFPNFFFKFPLSTIIIISLTSPAIVVNNL